MDHIIKVAIQKLGLLLLNSLRMQLHYFGLQIVVSSCGKKFTCMNHPLRLGITICGSHESQVGIERGEEGQSFN